MKPGPWDFRWEVLETLPQKDQGKNSSTHLVQRKQAPFERGVLKLLNRNEVVEKRKRFYIEVANLKILETPQISKLVDSNYLDYENPKVSLYLVTEHVPGSTLESTIREGGPIPLGTAVEMTVEILRTLSYCHGEGVVHRDIKPDNIIIRDRAPRDAVLLDFGMSFNREAVDERLTEDGLHVGNRFLLLPELAVSGSNKRDPRSDLTFAAGLMFFALVGEYPTHLLDGEGRAPQDRASAAAAWSRIPEALLRNRVRAFFGRSFRHDIALRWQDAHEMIGAAHGILEVQMDGNFDLQAELALLDADPEMALATRRISALTAAYQQITGGGNDAVAASKSVQLEMTRGNWTVSKQQFRASGMWGIYPVALPIRSEVHFDVVTTAHELFVLAREGGANAHEIARVPFDGVENGEIREAVRSTLDRALARELRLR